MLPNIKNDANPFLLLKAGARVVSHCPNNEIVIFWILRYEGSGFMSLNKIKLLNSPDHSSSEDGPLYSESGVDLTLIRWMLSLTPAERLQMLQQTIRSIVRLKSDISNT